MQHQNGDHRRECPVSQRQCGRIALADPDAPCGWEHGWLWQTPGPNCATCQTKHRGRLYLSAASNQACAVCHAALKNRRSHTRYVSTITSFEDQHPEFALLRANVRTRWMPHARFDHDAHGAFSCVSCHPKALTGTEASDILLPGMDTCKRCHAPGAGHADSRCSECHTYHDWSKRKEVTPKFTLPGWPTGGQ